MGRMKHYAMELEDQFWSIAEDTISEYETFKAWINYLMGDHYDKIMHLNEDNLMEELRDMWQEHWYKYAEMQEPVESEE